MLSEEIEMYSGLPYHFRRRGEPISNDTGCWGTCMHEVRKLLSVIAHSNLHFLVVLVDS